MPETPKSVRLESQSTDTNTSSYKRNGYGRRRGLWQNLAEEDSHSSGNEQAMRWRIHDTKCMKRGHGNSRGNCCCNSRPNSSGVECGQEGGSKPACSARLNNNRNGNGRVQGLLGIASLSGRSGNKNGNGNSRGRGFNNVPSSSRGNRRGRGSVQISAQSLDPLVCKGNRLPLSRK